VASAYIREKTGEHQTKWDFDILKLSPHYNVIIDNYQSIATNEYSE
jgi:hypothetical protein